MDINRHYCTETASKTAEVGQNLALELAWRRQRRVGTRILCLYGDLGSGKTTFVQGFARGLGIKGRLLSPTFIIVRRYQIPLKNDFLFHIDLYRVSIPEQMKNLGFSEIFSNPYTYILIEWAEKLENVPKKRIDIHFSVDARQRHHITVKECL
jgi:tRNA threonylcarbamoyladenosine biosynthesis protein TsaE